MQGKTSVCLVRVTNSDSVGSCDEWVRISGLNVFMRIGHEDADLTKLLYF